MTNLNNRSTEKMCRIAKKIEQIKAENAEYLKALERNNQFMECLANNILAIADVCEPIEVQLFVVSTLKNEGSVFVRKA